MNGKMLRGRVDAFQDVLTDVKQFIKDKNKFNVTSEELIERIKDECEELFYLIPLEEK